MSAGGRKPGLAMLEAHQGGVDAVHAGARHEADEKLGHGGVSAAFPRPRCRQQVELFHQGFGMALEVGHVFLRQRHGGGQLVRQGVDVLAVDAELVMQVRPGREAGVADVADDLALLDLASLFSAPWQSPKGGRRPWCSDRRAGG